MCSGRARRKKFKKTLHAVTIPSLEPDTQYEYRIAGDSTEHTFVSRPRAGSKTQITFAAFGDMGFPGGKKTTMASATYDAIMKEHTARPYDVVLHVGDLAYADGTPRAWDDFMDMIEGLASEVPYMVAIGNHEYAYSGPADNDPSGVPKPYRPDWGNFGDESGGECGAMFAHHFLMPSPSGTVARRVAALAAHSQAARLGLESAAGMAATATQAQAAVTPAAGAAPVVTPTVQSTLAVDAVAPAPAHLPETLAPAPVSSVGGRRLLVAASAATGGTNNALLSMKAPAAAAVAPSTTPASGPVTAANSTLPSPPDNAPFWYSFDYGIAHFTILSSEHDLSRGTPQHTWLQADLASVDRCVTPWLIVALHRPMYVVYPHKSNRDVGEHLREELEDLLLEYRVDLVLSGHVHSYYRSCSVRQEVCTDDGSGMVHLVIGTGGHTLSSVDSQQRLWCRAAATDAGFGQFSIDGEQMKVQFIGSADSQVLDEFTLYSQVPSDECIAYMAKRRLPGVALPAQQGGAEGQGQEEQGSGAGKQRKHKKGGSKADKAARKAVHEVQVVDRPEPGEVPDSGEHSDDGDSGGDKRRR